MQKLYCGKRLIFTITPGRSGTGYLSRILNVHKEIASFHEPEPKFSDFMREVQSNPKIALDFWIKKKLPFIRNIKSKIYVETSHLFCKGFLHPLIDIGIIPDIIILKRSHREVALSLLQLKTIPGRTDKGLKFLLSPEDKDVIEIRNWHLLTDYQLCYWYCLEIERRQKSVEKYYLTTNSKIISITIDELSTIKGFKRLFEQFELPKLDLGSMCKYLFIKNIHINMKERKKSKIIVDNIEDQEKEVGKIFNKNITN